MSEFPTAAVAFVIIASCLSAPVARGEEGMDQKIKIDAGAAFFASECQRCHSVEADKQTYGPPLENVIGRAAGKVDGYDYSPALAGAGFTWTDGALRAWMEDNQAFVPGTKMRHVGITDPVIQSFILSYLQDAAKTAN